ncbi:MAG: hypothetical protein OHK0037_04800 [Elainellaceae cyanobacterium]
MLQSRPSDISGAHAVDALAGRAIAPGTDQHTASLEAWAEQSYRRLLTLLCDRPSPQPADHTHARMLLLGLLCVPLYQQRRLLPANWQSIEPDTVALDQLLIDANQRYGLAFPVAGLPRLSAAANAELGALLRQLQTHAPYPVVRLGQLYEQCLAWAPPSAGVSVSRTADRADSRKAQGSYYTPEPLVDYCIAQTLKQQLDDLAIASLADLQQLPRILDPAAGGGAFLLAAYETLLQWAGDGLRYHTKPTGATVPNCPQQPPIAPVDWATRQQLLRHCIYGVDLDETAIALTRLSLQLKLLEGERPPGQILLPDLSQNLVCAESLLGLDWISTFPTAAEAGGFDVVLGNPPYIDAEQMSATAPAWRRVCTQRYRCARGNWDMFCVFIERSLELCRPGGMTSLVVPNKLRSAGYAATARSLLTEHGRLLALRDYAQVAVFRAAVYPLVYVARKGEGREERGREGEGERGRSVGEAIFAPYEVMESLTVVRQRRRLYAAGSDWWLCDSQRAGDLMARLQQFPTLGQIAPVWGAATVAEAYSLQRWICENATPSASDLRLVNSGTLDRYRMLWGDRPLRYLGDRYLHPTLSALHLRQLSPQRQQQAAQPKLIVAGMTQRLECALDETGGILAGKSTSIIQLPNRQAPSWQASNWQVSVSNCLSCLATCSDLLWLLLAILNSSLIQWYFVQRHGGNALQGGYLRVGPPQLRQIPIALDAAGDRPALCQTLIDLAKRRQQTATVTEPRAIAQFHTQLDAQLDAQIDAAVYALYELRASDIAEIR